MVKAFQHFIVCQLTLLWNKSLILLNPRLMFYSFGDFFLIAMWFKNFTLITTGFIVIMCLVMVYFMLFTDLMIETMNGTKRIAFIVVMLIYAAFRSYRLYKLLQNN